MGRTGTRHAWEQEGITPDIEMVAKGLGGGYQPIGAVLITSAIAEVVESAGATFAHGHTYMAHPIACAAALAVQRVIEAEDLLSAVNRLGRQMAEQLSDAFKNHPHVGDVRGRGLLQAIEIVQDRSTKAPFPSDLRVHARLKHDALDRGLACYPMGGTVDGRAGDHVLLAPPFICSADNIDQLVTVLVQSVDAVTTEARRLAA
jgi:adenosylmethionine-8-amino-7-oxononanoate aminotransferase